MNQRMYINYLSAIYFLTSIYKDNLDSNLKNAIRNISHYLHIEVDKYKVPHQDKTLKNFNVRDLDYNTLLVKTKHVMAIIKEMSTDNELALYAGELLEYLKILEKINKMKEIEEGKRNEKY